MERVWVSPPPHIITTAQGACIFEKRMIHRSPPRPKILGQKTQVTSSPSASTQLLALAQVLVPRH